jgi:tetratricopeptide (TPR) repeat protein
VRKTLLAALALALPAILILGGRAAGADVIHLRNGGSITADSWEIRGSDLLVRQGGGVIVVPRSEVVRIVAAPPGAARASAGDRSTMEPATTLSRDEALRALDDLKRRIRDDPQARAENTRRLVALLNQLGMRAYGGRDYAEADGRFREALQYDPRNSQAQLGLAATCFGRGEHRLAASILERAILDHPDHPDLHALLGSVYYGQDKVEEALAEWQKSHALRPDRAVRERIDKLLRERSIDGAYRRSEAAHFTLKYDGEKAGAELGDQILAHLDEEFAGLSGRFDYNPSQPIVVILYPQRQFYAATGAEANVAGLFDGTIRVPIGGLRQISPDARRVLRHELAHAFIAGKSRGTAPRWLHEGIAQHIEGQVTSRATGATLARKYQDLGQKEAWGLEFSYPAALSLVEFLIEREGFHRLMDVLEKMAGGASAEAAFERATHYSLSDLRDAWGKALVGKHLH